MFTSYDIPRDVAESLAAVGSFGLAKSTWSTYRTAERQLLQCQKDTKASMELPLSQNQVLIYIDWLIRARKVKSSTISSYLAGVRQLHLVKGIDPPNIRSAAVRMILKGKSHMDSIEDRAEPKTKRLPMTLNLMRLLKAKIRVWDQPEDKRLLTWAVCTAAFHGSFRIHEILARESKTFDPDFTLLGKDVKLTTSLIDGCERRRLSFYLKSPKEDRTGKTVVVDVYETFGSTCPVKAFRKWSKQANIQDDKPLFCSKQGKPLTGRVLNSNVKSLLEDHIDYGIGGIWSHSFRAGIPSLMAEKGFQDKEIQITGRWNSRAFEFYTKNPSTNRERITRRLGKM
jgi:hypothetical protein